MNHKTYVREINKRKALYNHNDNHKEEVDQDCEFCSIFPKATIVIKAAKRDYMFIAEPGDKVS